MKIKKLVNTTLIIIFSVLSILLIWDVIVALMNRFDATISKQTQLLSSKFPLLPWAWGLLEGHFFYGKLGRFTFGRIPKLRYVVWIPLTVAMLVICIKHLFTPITFVSFMGENLFIPSMVGQIFGLAWYQEELKK